jgi:DHA1 family bicyclomycin/chloramphenicol resistance-like MFS transporter
VIAPLAGSALLLIMPWRGIFYILAAYGLVILAVSYALIVETHPLERRVSMGTSNARERYRALLTDRSFIGIAIYGGMAFSGLFAYLSSSSFLFQDQFGFNSQQYGLLFAINSAGIIIGVQSSSRIAKHFGPQWILAIVSVVLLLSATAIVVLASMHVGIWGVAIPLWFFICACGFGFPCVQVIALAHHGKEAGTAASLLGAVNFGLAGLISPLVSVFGAISASSMGITMMWTSAIAILSLWILVRPRSVPALAH